MEKSINSQQVFNNVLRETILAFARQSLANTVMDKHGIDVAELNAETHSDTLSYFAAQLSVPRGEVLANVAAAVERHLGNTFDSIDFEEEL